MAASPAACARRATSAGAHSPSEAVEWQCRSTCAVCRLRRRPRGLGLAEQREELALGELRQRAVGRPVAHRGIPCHAPLGLRPGAQLEEQGELVAAVDRHAARGSDLPRLAVYYDRAPGHDPARETSLHSSQASGAYVAM